jgi:hypothetical protein
MTTEAIIFMALSWTFVLGLVSWAFRRLLTNPRHFDPDGIGPGSPPVPGQAEGRV